MLKYTVSVKMPAEEWEDYGGWPDSDDPMGPDDPDDYLSEADE